MNTTEFEIVKENGMNFQSLNEETPFFLFTIRKKLKDVLNDFILEQGKSKISKDVTVKNVVFEDGMSGYVYKREGMIFGSQLFATLADGGFVVKRYYAYLTPSAVSYDFYNEAGDWVEQTETLNKELQTMSFLDMENANPVVNHIYNFLAHEYELATSGHSHSKALSFIKKYIVEVDKSNKKLLAYHQKAKDPAILNCLAKRLELESNYDLTWEESAIVEKKITTELKKIISTKKRTHNLSSNEYAIPAFIVRSQNKMAKYKANPWFHFKGLLYKYTIGVLKGFGKTVTSNLGFSIAFAIYSPFTFYFITQPINPQAMWAVGKVRGISLAISETVDKVMPNSSATKVVEEVSLAPIVAGAAAVAVSGAQKVDLPAKFPLSLDTKKYIDQDWFDRMNDFKSMQINYETSMQASERFGRNEQMETQFNFPLLVEALWYDLERYDHELQDLKENNTANLPELNTFIDNELRRTQDLQLYVWDKMYRFLSDYLYIMQDDATEQTQKSYYTGHAFIFFNKITPAILEKVKTNPSKLHLESLEKLAKKFKDQRIQGADILDRLNKNSKLFQQKNIYDGNELRSYMKRHWEVIYLQQNKAQESAHFGVQIYMASLKNALWTIQTITSNKRAELVQYKDLLLKGWGTKDSSVKFVPITGLEELFEHMLHFLTFDYVSVKNEVSSLEKDPESTQRRMVIEGVRSFIKDRKKMMDL
jgi:hypothetical protein